MELVQGVPILGTLLAGMMIMLCLLCTGNTDWFFLQGMPAPQHLGNMMAGMMSTLFGQPRPRGQ